MTITVSTGELIFPATETAIMILTSCVIYVKLVETKNVCLLDETSCCCSSCRHEGLQSFEHNHKVTQSQLFALYDARKEEKQIKINKPRRHELFIWLNK